MKVARKLFLGDDFFKLFTKAAILFIFQKLRIKLSKIVLFKLFLQEYSFKLRALTNSVGGAYFSHLPTFKNAVVMFNGPVFVITTRNTISFKKLNLIVKTLTNDFLEFAILAVKIFNTCFSKKLVHAIFEVPGVHGDSVLKIFGQLSSSNDVTHIFDPISSSYNNLNLLNYYVKIYLN